MKPTFDFTTRPYIKAAAERTRAEIDRLNNPHEFRVASVCGGFTIVDPEGNYVGPDIIHCTYDAANDAIGAMIADDDADRRLNRNRHESMGD